MQTRSERKTRRVPPANDFLWQYVYSTPIADAANELDEDRRADLQQEVVSGWEPFTEDGGVVLEVDLTSAPDGEPERRNGRRPFTGAVHGHGDLAAG